MRNVGTKDLDERTIERQTGCVESLIRDRPANACEPGNKGNGARNILSEISGAIQVLEEEL
jgi:hypothetical protein